MLVTHICSPGPTHRYAVSYKLVERVGENANVELLFYGICAFYIRSLLNFGKLCAGGCYPILGRTQITGAYRPRELVIALGQEIN